MSPEKFNQLWEISFLPKAREMQKTYPNLRLDKSKKETIYEFYQTRKSEVHRYMTDTEGKKDRHKIASILIESIFLALPFTGVNDMSGYDLKFAKAEYMPNEVFAWHCAMSTVLSFIITTAKQEKDEITLNHFSKGFIFPPCSHDNYQVNVLRSLYYSRNKKTFDIFTFSHILFFLEEYTKTKKVNNALY